MPFTFSHPAIVLPLNYLPKKWFSLSGLIIGSLTPDFEYFLRIRIRSYYSHTLDGLFWFDLPLGLLLVFVYHNLVRNSLFDNSPTFLKARCVPFRHFNWNAYFKKNWIVVLISLLIGAASHLLWDSFTHSHGYFVETIPALSNTVDIQGLQIPIMRILQHTSTLLGGGVIIYAIYRLPVNQPETTNEHSRYWIVFSILTIIFMSTRLYLDTDFKVYVNQIVIAISSVLFSLVLTPVLVKNKVKS